MVTFCSFFFTNLNPFWYAINWNVQTKVRYVWVDFNAIFDTNHFVFTNTVLIELFYEFEIQNFGL